MKKLLIPLLLFSSLALGDTPPADPPPSQDPNVRILEFDSRCIAPIKWAMNLMNGRKAGITEKEMIQAFALQMQSRNYEPEVIDYMLVIIGFVYEPDLDPTTFDGAEKILRHVERTCVDFADVAESEPPKKDSSLST